MHHHIVLLKRPRQKIISEILPWVGEEKQTTKKNATYWYYFSEQILFMWFRSGLVNWCNGRIAFLPFGIIHSTSFIFLPQPNFIFPPSNITWNSMGVGCVPLPMHYFHIFIIMKEVHQEKSRWYRESTPFLTFVEIVKRSNSRYRSSSASDFEIVQRNMNF